MKEIINELDNQLTSGNREAWATADDKFHQLLVEICGNKRLAKIAAALRDQSHRARPLTLIPRDVASLSTRYHKELIAAICAGDVAKAKVLHHEYRQESATQLVATLRNFPHTRL
jgi:DNA-binding GntR family transcriptional regulator